MVTEEQVEEKMILTSTPEKAPSPLAPLQLAQLRVENADSFDMEEVRCSPGFSMRSLWFFILKSHR